jgi:hypothetical protein
MSNIVLKGSTSGDVTIAVPAEAGSNTLTIPASTGEMLTTVSTSSNVIPTINNATAVATTSGTAIDFTSIPSGVKRISMMFNQVSCNGTAPRLIQIGTSGGLVTSGYISSGAHAGAAQAGLVSTAGFLMGAGGAVLDKTVGIVTIQTLGSNIWAMESSTADGTAQYIKCGGGSITLGGVLDRVRLSTTSGATFDHGSVNIAWEY